MKKSEELELAPPTESQLSVPPASGNQLLPTIEAVIKSGITAENAEAVKTLLGVYERLQEKDAERQFNSAFVALQADLPVIVASTVIPNRGKYERFEDVMQQIGPALKKNGFSVSFSMENKENRIIETCHLRHISGHSQSNSFAVRTGGKSDSETQADCKAATTAKRNALLNCLNIVVRQDALQEEEGDARIEGERIGFDEVQYLREELIATASDERKFLALAGVNSLEEITVGSLGVLKRALSKKPRVG